jgi:hypothetical protein
MEVLEAILCVGERRCRKAAEEATSSLQDDHD